MRGVLHIAAVGLCSLVLWPAVAAAQTATPVRVFACEPEWAALAHELLPDAQVFSATTVLQDPHHIEARPALIAQLRQADLAVCTGGGLEAGWLPALQQRAGNARVQDGAKGMFYAASHVSLINPQAATLNPFAGDVHPDGNPHLHADPERLAMVARALSAHVQRHWPASAAAVSARQAAFEVRWSSHIAQLRQRAHGLKGQAVAAQHSSFAYLWDWLGMQQVMDLEPRPGLPPTPSHLNGLLQRWPASPPLAVVVASHQDPRSGRWLTDRAQPARPLVVLPATVTQPSAPRALEQWFDHLVDNLIRQLPRPTP
ncbi:MAG: zinc ABC transporter substrate-binding protein [Betaproteobacteria bacterium]|nr:zinc ABC transporter substrate-binding protein [Betaproteobacteria bacterium]